MSSKPMTDVRAIDVVKHNFDALRGLLAHLADTAKVAEAEAALAHITQRLTTSIETLPLELRGIAETLDEGSGIWCACSGCHELDEGHDTGPYSETLRCVLGGGCTECGGIGAVWDTTDYAAMADALAADEKERAA